MVAHFAQQNIYIALSYAIWAIDQGYQLFKKKTFLYIDYLIDWSINKETNGVNFLLLEGADLAFLINRSCE